MVLIRKISLIMDVDQLISAYNHFTHVFDRKTGLINIVRKI